MKHRYVIEGMTCGGCVASVKRGLLSVPGVYDVDVRLENGETAIFSETPLELGILQGAIGSFRIRAMELPEAPPSQIEEAFPEVAVQTYRPLILIVSFIAGFSFLAQFPFDHFSVMLWMRHFMAGFFIVFAFFKLLNLKGFAASYSMYDILAAKWMGWGYVYPFVELALGILYLINVVPFATHVATVLILGLSSIGVIESNLNKRKIKCACLGDVFNLPMSTVTIVEDLGMVIMAALMLFNL